MSKPFFKFAHLSDLHIGYCATRHTDASGINVREQDGHVALDKTVTEIIESEVDFVIMAGDNFHWATPSVRSILFLREQLWRLWEASIPVYALGGNHETLDVAADISSAALLHDPLRGLYSHVEPYVRHEVKDGVFLHLVSHHMYGEQFETMKKIQSVEGAINIFSTHGSVIDPLLQIKLHTEQSPREIVIPDELLKDNDWSYIILGHIHERGWAGSKDGLTDTFNSKMFYNGSLIRRNFADDEVPLGRGWTLWEVDDKGVFTPHIKKIAQRPQVDFPTINAKDLTASEISEIIIDNLRKTQIDGKELYLETAPILRQNLMNIDAAKEAALDWRGIEENKTHALEWKTNKIPNNSSGNEENSNPDDKVKYLESISSSDIVEAFLNWEKKSKMLENITTDQIRDKVSTQAKSFIKLGQEKTIERED